LDDAPAVFLADDAFVFLCGVVVVTPVCHREDSHTLTRPAKAVETTRKAEECPSLLFLVGLLGIN